MSEYLPGGVTTPESHATSEIPGGYYRYGQQARRLQIEYTGSPDVYLDPSKEQEYAQIIETAAFAQKGLDELAATDEDRARTERERYEPLLAASVRAQHALIETNLRFAAHYARASMNILSTRAELAELPSRGRPGAYGDITRLRSRYAELEDRTQVANEALVRAAQTFTQKVDSSGKPISFLSHAKYYIHGAISKYAKTEETPGWFVNANQMDKLYAARRNTANTPAQEAERLAEMDKGRYTTPLEEPRFTDDETPLTLDDVVADINGRPHDSEILYALREARIEKMLDTLSEREAGVISMRFGLDDGESKTMDEIGAVYGVTRERIRQIEAKAMSKLRHPSRSRGLKGLIDLEVDAISTAGPLGIRPVTPGFANIRTRRLDAKKGADVSDAVDEESPLETLESQKESWQAVPDEPWDMQPAAERVTQKFERIAQEFELLLYNAPVYTFQQSFAQEMKSSHPIVLIESINEQLGDDLTSSHVEDFWNHNLTQYVASLQEQLGDDFSLDRVSALFSRLLAERMKEDDQVELLIPTEFQGKLNGLGAGLQTGELTVLGDLRDFAGQHMGGVAHMIVRGSVGDFAAASTSGYATLEVYGDAQHFVGRQLDQSASVHVHGSVGDFCGQGMMGVDAYIGVDGDAGEDVGEGARRGVIEVQGGGYSAHPNSAALISGEFTDWIDSDERTAREVTARLGDLAISHPEGVEIVEQALRHRPIDPEVILAKIEAAAQHISAESLKDTTTRPMRADLPPEWLTFRQACAWLGTSEERLNECLAELGHAEDADLSSSDVVTLTELYPEFHIEMAPESGFSSIEQTVENLGIRDSPKRFLRLLLKHNVPLYEFRDVDGRVKYFISDENLA